MACRPLLDVPEEATQRSRLHGSAAGIVGKLVFSYLSHAEMLCLRMGNHQPAGRGMGLHGTVFREGDSGACEVYNSVQYEVKALVG